MIGPIKNDSGWYLLKVDDRQAGGRDTILDDFSLGVSDEEYRDYIRQEVLRGDFQQYFKDTVLSRYQPQREVAQIFLNLDQGSRCRSCASATCWCSRSPESRTSPLPPPPSGARPAGGREAAPGGGEQKDGQWWELAAQSDDTGSATRGGYLGWYDRPPWRSSSCPSSPRPPMT